MTNTHQGEILEIINETHDVRTLRIKFPDTDSFSFLPGQFVMLTINSDPEKQKRSYSMASSPTQTNAIDITFRIEGKFTSKLGSLQKGDALTVMGPYGHFTFHDGINHGLVLVAGGTGIAPFRSYIRYIIDKKLRNKVTLIYSSKTPEDIIYYNELKQLELKNNNLKCIFTVTRHLDKWEGLTGRIDEDMIKAHVANLPEHIFYSCGPTELVNEVVAILKNNNVKDEQIKTEKWG